MFKLKTLSLALLVLCSSASLAQNNLSQNKPFKPTEKPPLSSDTRAPVESDAAQLFRRVDYYLTQYYRGPTQVKVDRLLEETRVRLQRSCGKNVRCTFSTAEKSIRPMIAALKDAHTYLMPPIENRFWSRYEEYRMGVNLRPYMNAGARVVVNLWRGGAADQVGIRRGDVILRINGVKPGAFVPNPNRSNRLTVLLERRGSYFTRTLNTRAWEPENDLPSLSVRGKVGILKIPTFYEDSYDGNEIGREVHRLIGQANARRLERLVVDVRDNGGGQLTNCMVAANAFVPQLGYKLRHALADLSFTYKMGVLTLGGNDLVQNRLFFQQQEERTRPYARWSKPVAVLVNEETASCGEIFAYLLQKVGRGPIIGEKTYGVSNSATRYFGLPGDYAMGVTIGQLHNFDGSRLPAFITPNILVKDDLELLNKQGWDGALERGILVTRDIDQKR